jgi:hypothetical protein
MLARRTSVDDHEASSFSGLVNESFAPGDDSPRALPDRVAGCELRAAASRDAEQADLASLRPRSPQAPQPAAPDRLDRTASPLPIPRQCPRANRSSREQPIDTTSDSDALRAAPPTSPPIREQLVLVGRERDQRPPIERVTPTTPSATTRVQTTTAPTTPPSMHADDPPRRPPRSARITEPRTFRSALFTRFTTSVRLPSHSFALRF